MHNFCYVAFLNWEVKVPVSTPPKGAKRKMTPAPQQKSPGKKKAEESNSGSENTPVKDGDANSCNHTQIVI